MSRLANLPDLMVAPNGARRNKQDHPALPITISEIVEAATAAFAEGATALHAHVRDDKGRHSLDAGLYRELIAEMKAQMPDMPVQITTESAGLYAPDAQMAVVYETHPEGVSASIRELWRDPDHHSQVRHFYRWCEDANVPIQHIVYEPSDIALLEGLAGSGQLPKPRHCIVVLGSYTQNRPGRPEEIKPILDGCQRFFENIDWAVCAFGSREHDCLLAAHRFRGKLRVGFENNMTDRDGHVFLDNAQSVRSLSEQLKTTV